jgi:hypothetical protein
MTGQPADPFAALGLAPSPSLVDEEVRAAWRVVAAATHPDRADGGDPGAYRAASAAYAALRTAWGRAEAYADLTAGPLPDRSMPASATGEPVNPWRALALIPVRIWRGRPLRLALRVLAAVVLGVTVTRAGTGPGPVAGLVTGLGVWLVATGRGDLAPPPGR